MMFIELREKASIEEAPCSRTGFFTAESIKSCLAGQDRIATKKAEPLLALLPERRVGLFVDESHGLGFRLSFQVTIPTGTLPLYNASLDAVFLSR